MPDIPTLAEQGYPDLVVQEWFAVFMLRSVPSPRVDAGAQAVRLATARPEFVAALKPLGMTTAISTPAALAARIAREQRVWARLVLAAGIRVE
ncbi:tripartite tricarboxylate transporter substrate-binding protein [Variovorax sp. J22R24]|uniref:tripartite tricarboxylate transporter substrate-binding protein n=1 Tax=Variovorax gracilis TaxID=3053502 RepID=UPI0025761876|nr:tripartite tricarboxylate transporter substrate-binding protein [Variovorax sp. J22R24]MDM0109872.1 tripartite tricarboxylate transporter substrate-binding protein [Variovorax sp. J22R24]